ncbi:MAG: F510_1955 family glycosylhydrolase [Actinomycetales bacterium]
MIAVLAVASACSGQTESASPSSDSSTPESSATSTGAQSAAVASAPLDVSHIHAAVRNPTDQRLLIASHEGLFVQGESGFSRQGPVMDLMGFAVAPDGVYYASGHAGPGSDLPEPLGLLTSTDSGQTWTVRSRGGESDFHALAAGPGLIAGFDGTLRISTDGENWQSGSISAPPYAVAVTPGGRILATTSAGLLSSTDQAATWSLVQTPATLLTVAAVNEDTLAAATTEGTLALSRDGGTSWTTGPRSLGQVSAVSATEAADQVEIVAVVGTDVFTTTDLGASTTHVVG